MSESNHMAFKDSSFGMGITDGNIWDDFFEFIRDQPEVILMALETNYYDFIFHFWFERINYTEMSKRVVNWWVKRV